MSKHKDKTLKQSIKFMQASARALLAIDPELLNDDAVRRAAKAAKGHYEDEIERLTSMESERAARDFRKMRSMKTLRGSSSALAYILDTIARVPETERVDAFADLVHRALSGGMIATEAKTGKRLKIIFADGDDHATLCVGRQRVMLSTKSAPPKKAAPKKAAS